MPRWIATLRLTDVWDEYPDTMTLTEMAAVIAKRLRQMVIPGAHVVARQFDNLPSTGDADDDEVLFNRRMNVLYDWADEHRVWVETFSLSKSS